jgi:hypothetical protein
MQRLLQTTNGPVVIVLGRWPGDGASVTVPRFDADGWEENSGKTWSERVGYHERGENLSQFLAQALSIPDAEAEALAANVDGPMTKEWQRRGGQTEVEKIGRWSRALLAGLAALIALALLGVALLIYIIAT